MFREQNPDIHPDYPELELEDQFEVARRLLLLYNNLREWALSPQPYPE